tara:strand:- start:73 stop:462 length:390 start_codon:yes stop_codon:yes gene_type:complete
MFTISKTFGFEAAHYLPKVANDHKCRRMHGHSYKLTFFVATETLKDGMVVDYKTISSCAKPIVELFDHQVINDWIPNPTAENIAMYCSAAFIRKYKEDNWNLPRKIILVAIEVSETARTNCRYEVMKEL